MQQKKISIGPILFLYYKESLVSSNLNSKQLRFHGAHPKYIYVYGVQVAKIGQETELEIRKKKVADGCFPADQTGCQKQATFLSQLE